MLSTKYVVLIGDNTHNNRRRWCASSRLSIIWKSAVLKLGWTFKERTSNLPLAILATEIRNIFFYQKIRQTGWRATWWKAGYVANKGVAYVLRIAKRKELRDRIRNGHRQLVAKDDSFFFVFSQWFGNCLSSKIIFFFVY